MRKSLNARRWAVLSAPRGFRASSKRNGLALARQTTATPGLKYAKTPDPAETTIAGIFSDQNLTVSHLASRRFPCAQVSRSISCSRRASGIAAVTEDINDGAAAAAA